MKTSKIKYLFLITGLILFSYNLSAQAQAIPKISNYKYYTPAVKAPAIYKAKTITPINYLENNIGGGYSKRGKALEPIASSIYKKTIGRKFIEVDASYRSVNGLDGLFVKTNSRGHVTKVHIIEIKSGNATIEFFNDFPQCSKKWNLMVMDRSLAEYDSYIKWRTEEGNFKEVKKLSAEKELLRQSRVAVEHGEYDFYHVNITYTDGRLKVSQWKLLSEEFKKINRNEWTPDNVFKYGEEKVIANFSYLDKDVSNLNPFEKQMRQTLFDNIETQLKTMGKTPEEINGFMKELRTNEKFNPSNAIEQNVVEKETVNAIRKTQRKFKIQNNLLKGGFAAIAIFMEGKSIYNYLNGKISTSELVFDSVSNTTMLTAAFIPRLNPYMTVIFGVIDVAKNIYSYTKGSITKSDAIINITANISGLVTGTIAASALVSALSAAGIGGSVGSFIATPIGGAIIGGVAFAVTYGVTYMIVKWTGNKIVNIFESYKEPERFNQICSTISLKYNL